MPRGKDLTIPSSAYFKRVISIKYPFKRIRHLGSSSTIESVSHILEAANGGASKIQIMYRALLSYKQKKEYVNFLSEKGLLVYGYQQGGVQTFRTTEKGLRFVETYNWLNDMIKEEEE